jgi:hypothetical protein
MVFRDLLAIMSRDIPYVRRDLGKGKFVPVLN